MAIKNPITAIAAAIKKSADIASYYATEGIDLQRVDDELSAQRMQICKSCKIDGKTGLIMPFYQCRVCKCFMHFKTTLLFDPVESGKQGEKVKTVCPLGKW